MTAPNASGMTQAIDLLIQQAIVVGLAALAEDRRATAELVARLDSLRLNTGESWQEALAQAVRDAADPRSQGYARVQLGYPNPPGTAHLPCISVVQSSSSETPGEQFLGDLIDHRTQAIELPTATGTDITVLETLTHGMGYGSTLQIGTWTDVPELSAVLHAAVGWALQHERPRLTDAGVHELSFSDSGVQSDLDPRVAYVPLYAVTVGWTRAQSARRRVPNRITIRPPTRLTR